MGELAAGHGVPVITQHARRSRYRVEWPTLLLLVGCYGVWLGSGYYLYPSWPVAALLIMGVAVALHGSLQHEVLHGHPTRNALVNEALVFLSIGLFYPYRSYKHTHLQHHADERLTDPYDDPESYYKALADWARMPRLIKMLLAINNTLVGRVTIGPLMMILGFTLGEWRKIIRGDRKTAKAWALHAASLVPTLALIQFGFGIPVWLYALTAAYLGVALLSIRTYCEHQWSENVDGRTIIVETSILAPLFLNNNLHIVHHKLPTAAWYRLPGLYRERRAEWQAMNGGYVYSSYLDILKAHALRPKEPVVHPQLRRETAGLSIKGLLEVPVDAPLAWNTQTVVESDAAMVAYSKLADAAG
ncbi:fatty acid desaturase [Rhizobium halophytocola]|uniref:Fatty acid desaturase n=1 Tax=Rhizobium halophytocola TaxID=735519 RepID=A0ABS4E4T3_9HYPH|nr:fatty acid desaturase [Rhizobium halophytocola]MBP1852937.1 fatty acid desaturase [Rhizobium halophytocola]